MLGLAQDVSHSSITKVPKSLVLRARKYQTMLPVIRTELNFIIETRKTYRAVLSEPKLVIPDELPRAGPVQVKESNPIPVPQQLVPTENSDEPTGTKNLKRPLESAPTEAGTAEAREPDENRKKKRKKGKN